ncbi:hypothetical protein CWC31_01100 [Pseudoalteromonas ruthenica]|uniref:hypothetical protein n=1 Tax=Pseudoalteromonas ruthenica TaxID=151081 RepID=UPI001108A9C8|nr:hypothetical protein [Pseudoalteromonas ruthenica]TLX52464.1 hypothetical protein CWC31_01100 [Pseudoalteromonas ruthenica]
MRKGFLSLLVTAFLPFNCCYAGQAPSPGMLDAQQDFLQRSVQQTPFSAVVRVHSVSSITDDKALVWHIYRGEIITPIRGQQSGDISYAMLVEKGEEAVLPAAPVVLTLCLHENAAIPSDFYWPGTGAEFAITPELLQVAQLASARSDRTQKAFIMCD